jgi:hypothetical protein
LAGDFRVGSSGLQPKPCGGAATSKVPIAGIGPIMLDHLTGDGEQRRHLDPERLGGLGSVGC